jgi:predicted GH43/DUF377 family glycosyl hydrolase
LLSPERDYETRGFFGGVVFPSGAVSVSDETMTVYYGAADESVCAASASIANILDSLSPA